MIRKLWKSGYGLEEITMRVSEATGWSKYLSLIYLIDCLAPRVKFTVAQLRNAFNETLDEIDPEDRAEAWQFLMSRMK